MKKMIQLVIMMSLLSVVPAQADTLKIVTIGDSITQAESNRASYRYFLWKKLVDSGLDFDLVGSMDKQFSMFNKGPAPQPDYKGKKFDPDHEGHFAWRSDEIINGRGHDNGSGKGKLADWLKSYDVDMALIHLGTNDAFGRQPHDFSVKQLEEIIRVLRTDNPGVVIFLAKLIPAAQSPGDDKAVESFNQTVVPRVAKSMGTEQSPVIVVDHFTGFDLATDTYDKVHPTASGEEKMAEAWFDAISKHLKSRK